MKNRRERNLLRGANKDVRHLVRAALEQGWSMDLTGGGHLRLKSPDGKSTVSTSLHSSALNRAVQNFRAQLRACGVDV